MAVRVFVHGAPGGAQGAFGGIEVASLAQQEAEPLQPEPRDTVAGGHRFVGQRGDGLELRTA